MYYDCITKAVKRIMRFLSCVYGFKPISEKFISFMVVAWTLSMFCHIMSLIHTTVALSTTTLSDVAIGQCHAHRVYNEGKGLGRSFTGSPYGVIELF
jgi:hypothetical protein